MRISQVALSGFGRIFLLLVVGAFMAVPTLSQEKKHTHSHTFTAGEPGDPKKPARIIEVLMGRQEPKMFFKPDVVEVRRGEQIRFVLKNIDPLKDHEFVLATREENQKHAEEMKASPNMKHDDPNGKTLSSSEHKELIWRFTRTGEFEFSCNLPGHREAGMVGKVIVK